MRIAVTVLQIVSLRIINHKCITGNSKSSEAKGVDFNCEYLYERFLAIGGHVDNFFWTELLKLLRAGQQTIHFKKSFLWPETV